MQRCAADVEDLPIRQRPGISVTEIVERDLAAELAVDNLRMRGDGEEVVDRATLGSARVRRFLRGNVQEPARPAGKPENYRAGGEALVFGSRTLWTDPLPTD